MVELVNHVRHRLNTVDSNDNDYNGGGAGGDDDVFGEAKWITITLCEARDLTQKYKPLNCVPHPYSFRMRECVCRKTGD